jgi:hypothetical protein
MVIPSLLTQFYRQRIEDNLVYLQYLSRDMGEMNRVREAVAGNWELEEYVRHIIFLETQTIQSLRKEIESDQRTLKDLK